MRCAAYWGDDQGTEVISASEAQGRLDEQVGRGWMLMRQAMAEFGLPEPEIENDPVGRTVRVTLARSDQRGAAGRPREAGGP